MNYGEGSYQGGVGAGRDEYHRLINKVENNIRTINKNVVDIERSVDFISTERDTQELRNKIHKLQHGTNHQAKETSEWVKQLKMLPKSSIESEAKSRRIQMNRITDEFSSALDKFQRVQRKLSDKEKESFRRARVSSGFDNNPFSGENDKPLVDVGTEQVNIQIEQNVDLDLLKERENEIKKLESDIVGVNEIFKELGMMIHEQGTVIDSIEHHVDNTVNRVDQAREQLSKAQDYQTSSRKKKCIIAIIGVVLLAIIILIIVLTTRK
ncbi:DgyrCDS7862 [Dimorphilus gyrociliatus]|uniref:DgyrCDS7862 n=1 Tax=Dimorphilus gyrociliatus TaxID=2664684 RepID=A0A7I8VSE2_9ANNE|nr:DgyrCDS7862 [Dimorphilus gyrociliatus]